MKNQEKNRSTDLQTGRWDQRIPNPKNREKALYDFSNIPGNQSQRMTQNKHKK